MTTTQWKVDFTYEADEDLNKLDKQTKERILDKIKWLRNNFDIIKHLPLGYDWQGFFKLRAGDWRVIYEIEYFDGKIILHRIEHRSKVYRKRKK